MSVTPFVTKADLDVLESARYMRDHHQAALMPDSVGDLSRYRKLERAGLLASAGYCKHIDTGREGEGFRLTDTADKLLAYQDERRARTGKAKP